MTKSKSRFRILAEAIEFEGLGSVDMSLEHLDKRRLTIDEIKDCIREAFKDAKKVSDVEAQTPTHGWGDAEIENEINWVKTLKLKEFFGDAELSDKEEDEEDDKPEEKKSEKDDR
jgi:hypothetical protein